MVYENAELATLLAEMATYYNYKVDDLRNKIEERYSKEKVGELIHQLYFS